MAEPTAALQYRDLVLRVAEHGGFAFYGVSPSDNTPAMLPVAKHDLDLAKRIVIDGNARLFSNIPPHGKWHWAQRIASIVLDPDGTGPLNISSDPGRYTLPDDFSGDVQGAPSFAKETQEGRGIRMTDESFIRRLREDNLSTDTPFFMAIRPFGTRQYEMLVFPDPSTAETIEIPYTPGMDTIDLETGIATDGTSTTLVDADRRNEADDTFLNWTLTIVEGAGINETATITANSGDTLTFSAGLSGGSTPDTTSVYRLEGPSSSHPAGFRFEHPVRLAALAQAEQQLAAFGRNTPIAYTQQYFDEGLPMAHRLDAQLAPPQLSKAAHRNRVHENIPLFNELRKFNSFNAPTF